MLTQNYYRSKLSLFAIFEEILWSGIRILQRHPRQCDVKGREDEEAQRNLWRGLDGERRGLWQCRQLSGGPRCAKLSSEHFETNEWQTAGLGNAMGFRLLKVRGDLSGVDF